MSGRRTRSAALLAGIAAALVLTAGSTAASGPGEPYRAKAARLRVQAQLLDTRAHRALLDLYALDSRLAGAQQRVSGLVAQSTRLRGRQQVLARELSAARRTLAASQQQLGDRLRGLYERGSIDPLAVVLGAQSLDDALTKLEDLTSIADQSRQVVAVTLAARTRLERVRSALAAQRRALDATLAAALASRRELTAAHAARVSFVSGLQTQQRLKDAQIRSLLATAQQVELKSQKLQAKAAARAAADPPTTSAGQAAPGQAAPGQASPEPVATGSAPAPAGGRTLVVSATGYSLPGRTATGLPVGWGIVAVDPSVIPLGTRLTVPGYGEAVAADVGSAVRGATIDLWFPSLAEALAWGRRTITITLH